MPQVISVRWLIICVIDTTSECSVWITVSSYNLA